MLAFLTNYWWIFALVAVVAIVVITIIKDKKNAKKWLLYAVAAAEKELGAGTGALKLQMVYDKFLEKFPVFGKFLPYETFKALVDKALAELKELLDENEAIKKTIEE